MNITTRSKYAVRALVELAERAAANGGRPVPLNDLADRRGLPPQFLEQVFAALRRAGVVSSRRGASGGYVFARPPQAVTVLEVVEALDGHVGPSACTTGRCRRSDECGAASVWADATAALEGVLAGTSIAALAEREQAATMTPTYDI